MDPRELETMRETLETARSAAVGAGAGTGNVPATVAPRRAARLVQSLLAIGKTATNKAKGVYQNLEKAYGKKGAIAILTARQVTSWGAFGAALALGAPSAVAWGASFAASTAASVGAAKLLAQGRAREAKVPKLAEGVTYDPKKLQSDIKEKVVKSSPTTFNAAILPREGHVYRFVTKQDYSSALETGQLAPGRSADHGNTVNFSKEPIPLYGAAAWRGDVGMLVEIPESKFKNPRRHWGSKDVYLESSHSVPLRSASRAWAYTFGEKGVQLAEITDDLEKAEKLKTKSNTSAITGRVTLAQGGALRARSSAHGQPAIVGEAGPEIVAPIVSGPQGDMPDLAKGQRVDQPTVLNLGAHGPQAVIPEAKMPRPGEDSSAALRRLPQLATGGVVAKRGVFTEAKAALEAVGHKRAEAKRLVDVLRGEPGKQFGSVQSVLRAVYARPEPSASAAPDVASEPAAVSQPPRPRSSALSPSPALAPASVPAPLVSAPSTASNPEMAQASAPAQAPAKASPPVVAPLAAAQPAGAQAAAGAPIAAQSAGIQKIVNDLSEAKLNRDIHARASKAVNPLWHFLAGFAPPVFDPVLKGKIEQHKLPIAEEMLRSAKAKAPQAAEAAEVKTSGVTAATGTVGSRPTMLAREPAVEPFAAPESRNAPPDSGTHNPDRTMHEIRDLLREMLDLFKAQQHQQGKQENGGVPPLRPMGKGFSAHQSEPRTMRSFAAGGDQVPTMAAVLRNIFGRGR